MAVRARPIKSCADGACRRPFVEYSAFTVTRTGIEFAVTRVTGPAASPECKSVDATKERTLEKAYTLAFDPLLLTETHALAITLDGAIEFVPLSKQKLVYYAHLAFVDPVTGAADVLAFVDEDEHTAREPS